MNVPVFFNLVAHYMPQLGVRSIFDCGCYDCSSSYHMACLWTEANIVAFEASQDAIIAIPQTIRDHPRIRVVPKALAEMEGDLQFFRSTSENKANSSLFMPSGEYDKVELMPFDRISVTSVRLDSFIEQSKCDPPQLLWLDLQGGELGALRSLGRYLRGVKAIWTEYLIRSIYANVPLIDDLHFFLTGSGFKQIARFDQIQYGDVAYWGDACYIRL